MAWSIIEDLEWGHFNERKVIEWLNNNLFIKDNMKLYKNERKQVDFKNTEIIAELKSRTNKYDKYPTTFFGYNKLEYLLNKWQRKQKYLIKVNQRMCPKNISAH